MITKVVLIHMCKYIQIVRQRLDQSVLIMETESQARGKSPTNLGTKLPTAATAVIVFVNFFYFNVSKMVFFSYNLLIELIYHSTHGVYVNADNLIVCRFL